MDIDTVLDLGMTGNQLKSWDKYLLKSLFAGTAVSCVKGAIFGKFEFSDQKIDQMAEAIWQAVKK